MAFRPPALKAVSSTGGSFSIKDILDLPEEPHKTGASSKSDALQRPCVVRPLVPLAIKPRFMFDANSLQLCAPWPLGSSYCPGWAPDRCGYPAPDFLQGYNPNWRRTRRPLRKKKQRPLFSPRQVQTLENEFRSKKYLTEEKRTDLSTQLKLTETQVKTWFQNRRTKWRKETKNKGKVSAETAGGFTCKELGTKQHFGDNSSPPTNDELSSTALSSQEDSKSPMYFIDLNYSRPSGIKVMPC